MLCSGGTDEPQVLRLRQFLLLGTEGGSLHTELLDAKVLPSEEAKAGVEGGEHRVGARHGVALGKVRLVFK